MAKINIVFIQLLTVFYPSVMTSWIIFFFQVVAYVHIRHPSSVMVAVSEGSGSGTLLSYLGESGSSSCLKAAAAISPVLRGQLWFETAMPPVYRWGALIHRKLQLSR